MREQSSLLETPRLKNDTILPMLSFFSWWYGAGWFQVAHSLPNRLAAVNETLSVHQLLRTLFAPWKRIISYAGNDIGDKFRATLDNLFSRMVGFVVRILFLLAAAVLLLTVSVVTVIEMAVWPLLPLAVPALLIAGSIL